MNNENLKKLVRKVTEAAKESSSPYIVTDFDNTCINNDISHALFYYLCENNLLKDATLLSEYGKSLSTHYHQEVFHRYYNLLKQGKNIEAYTFIPKILSGFSIDEMRDIVEKVLAEESRPLGFRELFGVEIEVGLSRVDKVYELLREFSNADIPIHVVSASPSILVETALDYYFGDIATQVHGIEYKLYQNKFTKDLVTPLPMFDGKVEVIKSRIHSAEPPLIVLGDSSNDMAMLEYGQEALVVDRGGKFTQYAESKEWAVISP